MIFLNNLNVKKATLRDIEVLVALSISLSRISDIRY
jgi:hypothetical protein